MLGYRWRLGIAMWVLGIGAPAQAAGPMTATLKPNIGSCKVFLLRAGKYVPVPQTSFKAGQKVSGQAHRTRAELFIAHLKSGTYAIPVSCLSLPSADSASTAGGSNRAPDPAPVEAPVGAARKIFEARFRFLFYQDTVNITDPDNGDFSVVSQITTICAGLAYHRPINARLGWLVDACVMFGFGDANGTFTGSTTTVTYGPDHASVFGLRVAPGIEFPFQERDFSIGLSAPLIYQIAGWGDPAGTSGKASGSGLRFPGLVLTLQATRDRYGFIADFGFMKKPTQASYSIGMSYEF